MDYTDADGDRHIETFNRKKDADARHAIVAVNIGRGTRWSAERETTRIADAADSWIQTAANGREPDTRIGISPAHRPTYRP